MKRLQTGLIFLLVFLIILYACKGQDLVATPTPWQQTKELGAEPIEIEEDVPLTFTLSEGVEQDEVPIPTAYVQGETLDPDALEALLARLPVLEPKPSDITDFNLPDEVIPPPRPGETIEESFPPESDAGTIDVDYGALEVLRYAPEGEIPIAPFVNITFNQPMVPLATLEDLSVLDVPVQVSPALPGTWRWLGTKTLNFQYDSELVDRLPMATEYEVIIPAGTESAVGGVLAEDVTFLINTPPLQMRQYHPWDEPQPTDALMFISFDQRIDVEQLLDHITVKADGVKVSIQLADKDAIAADEAVNKLVENAQESRYIVFRTDLPLPADAEVTVAVDAGAPSAEGPLLTAEAQSYTFYTYAPLKLVDSYCGWNDDCRPLMPFVIEFNNPIDMELFDETWLAVSPEIPGMSVDVYGNTVQITGMTAGRTTYKVTVSGDITDVFGQQLMRDENVRFAVGPAEPYLVGPGERFITLDPVASDPAISLFVMNYDILDLQVYRVQPSDWPDYLRYLDEYRWTDEGVEPPGTLLADETRSVNTKNDILSEISLKLGEYMDGKFGHFIAIIKPHQGFFKNENYWETVHVWAQVTQIGLDAFSDHSELVVWTSALTDGVPLAGVEITDSNRQIQVTTNKDGNARVDLPDAGAAYPVSYTHLTLPTN